MANVPIDGSRYRRSRVSPPTEATRFCSVTTVYMATVGGEEDFKGQYHAHPYGEINCVVPIDEGAELRGLNGWMGEGWTSPRESCPLFDNLPANCVQTPAVIITHSVAGAAWWPCSFCRLVGSATMLSPKTRCLLVLDLLFLGMADVVVHSVAKMILCSIRTFYRTDQCSRNTARHANPSITGETASFQRLFQRQPLTSESAPCPL